MCGPSHKSPGLQPWGSVKELNIHSLWSLIRIRPDMAAGPALVGELDTKIGRLLDENLVSAPARRELEAVRYGIAMARRD